MIDFFKPKIKLVVHDGDFHPDDIFTCATLSIWAEKHGKKLKIIRSRAEEIIEKADIVADVGGIYDPDKNRFDHHQKGGAGERGKGLPYASFGLVWKKYGAEICGSLEIANRIEKELVTPVDARDNGVNISTTNELGINDHRTGEMILDFNPTWQENKKLLNEQFEKVLYFAKEILKREIVWARALVDGEKETMRIIKEQNEPGILILDKEVEWHEAVSKYKNIKFIVYPEWRIQVGEDNPEDHNSYRVKFPQSWRGLMGENLEKVSGIKNAIFCTNNGWLAVAKTREAAIEMATKSLQIGQN